MTDEEILSGILEEFGKIAAVPRKSGHEKAISDFLRDRLKEMGLSVVQDESFNLIADKAASPGREDAPRTILQSHMDMVCVAAEGVAYNPLADPIHPVRDGGYLRAEGTSLGSDDGLGIAEILWTLMHAQDHGPLRAIFTVDEEQGMEGAIRLDEKHLQDADFLINCDSEVYDEITVGCAGSVNINFSRRPAWVPSRLPNGFRLELRGLLGGHSGERIGDGRANAIRWMAKLLKALSKRGGLELALLEGGTARNAIPSFATAVIGTELSKEEVDDCIRSLRRDLLELHPMEEGVSFICTEQVPPPSVLASRNTLDLLRLLTLLHTGTYAMSQDIPSLVETSANLGTIATTQETISIQFFPRSSLDQKVDDFRHMAMDLAALTGFDVSFGHQSPAWKERKDSRLVQALCEVFEEQNHAPMKVIVIHAGLECGWHIHKNPNLDIASIGVTTLDIHTPKEHLDLATVVPQAKLIAETLRRIARMERKD